MKLPIWKNSLEQCRKNREEFESFRRLQWYMSALFHCTLLGEASNYNHSLERYPKNREGLVFKASFMVHINPFSFVPYLRKLPDINIPWICAAKPRGILD